MIFNHLLLPVFLFFSFFCIISTILYAPNRQSNQDNSTATDLDKFYELITENIELAKTLDIFAEQGNFVKNIVDLGASLGYVFNVVEVENSLKANTVSEYDDHFCLPIGCWRKI